MAFEFPLGRRSRVHAPGKMRSFNEQKIEQGSGRRLDQAARHSWLASVKPQVAAVKHSVASGLDQKSDRTEDRVIDRQRRDGEIAYPFRLSGLEIPLAVPRHWGLTAENLANEKHLAGATRQPDGHVARQVSEQSTVIGVGMGKQDSIWR